MRKLWGIMIAVVLFTLVSGCGFRDIDKRFFIVMMGIDKGESKHFRISLKLAIPTANIQPGQAKYTIVTKEADTVSEGVRLMKADVDKELDFGHTKVIVFGKSLASETFDGGLDWFFRRRDIQQICYVAIGEPSALDILRQSPKTERLPGNSLILSFGMEGTESSHIVTEYLFDFYRRLKETGKDPYLPIIKTREDAYEINRVAVYDKKKVKAILTPEETRLFNQLVRRFPHFELSVEEGNPPFTISVQHFDYTYSISTPPNGKPSVDLNVIMRGFAEESRGMLFDKDWTVLEAAAAKAAEGRYVQLLKKLQKLRVDPVGFGLRYIATRHNGPKDWETWRRLYPEIAFHVKVKVKLEGTGLIK
ncbi:MULTISPECIES: Ger(x)C family spore germination protein [unclassified Paenibacillus]|uniref:Ger(x)C family spore germination protein n=1 Tax=unclassified Paenibacillus TaxID=185978 RepID=UPI001AE6159C|nr:MULTISPECIES: Ger(x)C family spore germination protein [unclassified Paenibacillus]MBP1154180.1 spore germination protein KC [Paenibacillus sp. PvP091]MBP1170435.1 spore germination protein KC [Paenibacillus sp. PvR098]MBP2441463.1 spore germination protein KC [Paenibacillus sp. PvP052]